MSLDSCDKTTVRIDDKSADGIMKMLGISNCCGCTTYYVDVPFDITFDAYLPERVREYESKTPILSPEAIYEAMMQATSRLPAETVAGKEKPDRYAVISDENGQEV